MDVEDKKSLSLGKRIKEALLNGAVRGLDSGVENAISDQFKKTEDKAENIVNSDSGKREDRIRSLELALVEQRKDYDQVNAMYESSRVKNYSMFAFMFGLLAYLYTSNDKADSLRERLFLPPEAYGVIIYVIGALLILYGMKSLIMALKSRPWKTAYDNDQDEYYMEDYERYLKYMRKRYLKCSTTNSKSYAEKQELLDEAVWPLIIGSIILLVIKIIGG